MLTGGYGTLVNGHTMCTGGYSTLVPLYDYELVVTVHWPVVTLCVLVGTVHLSVVTIYVVLGTVHVSNYMWLVQHSCPLWVLPGTRYLSHLVEQ